MQRETGHSRHADLVCIHQLPAWAYYSNLHCRYAQQQLAIARSAASARSPRSQQQPARPCKLRGCVWPCQRNGQGTPDTIRIAPAFCPSSDLLPMSLAFPPGSSLSWLRKVERRLSDLAHDAHASSARPSVRRQFSAPRRIALDVKIGSPRAPTALRRFPFGARARLRTKDCLA